MSIRSHAGMFVGIGLVLGACASKSATDEVAELAEDGSDSTATEGDAESLGASLIVPSSTGIGLASASSLAGGDLEMANIGDAVKNSYSPMGCVTTTSDVASGTASYTFDKCTGPYGLATVSGTISVTYSSPALNQLVLSFSGSAITINRSTIDTWSAQASITAAQSARDMTWNATLKGTTARGRAFQRTNSKEVTWTVGTSCVSTTGFSTGSIGARSLRTDLGDYTRCKDACPESGSTITVTDEATSASIMLTYGDASATYTATNGKPITFTPLCAL